MMIPTNVKDCVEVCHTIHEDSRGGFMELRRKDNFDTDFVQTNFSYSYAGVLRGLHVSPFAKLVTCVSGEIYDVVVDLRRESPTYKEYFAVYLNKESCKQVYVPPFCGHGFLALTDASVIYHQTAYYQADKEQVFNILDPALNLYIPKQKYNISARDADAENFPF